MSLRADYTTVFKRDVKRLKKKHRDTEKLVEVINLILANTPECTDELRRRHNMHQLKGNWGGSFECHVANAGDWLLVWSVTNNQVAIFERTGSHDEIFK